VMDASGSEKAAIFGLSEGGPMGILFAATYPERTSALILYGTFARGTYASDYPWRPTSDLLERGILDRIEREWGTGMTAKIFAPSIANDERQVEAWGRFERLAVSPGAARALIQMTMNTDVRDVLPVIQVPTLILHKIDDPVIKVDNARYIAERITGAKYVELPGSDHFAHTEDENAILDEVQEFLTGARHNPEPDRMLATVMFTDIARATERAVAMGDRQWRDLLEHQHHLVRSELQRFRAVKSIRPATVSSRRLTDRHGQLKVPVPSKKPLQRSD
jgi:hypothetical protein